MKPRNLIKCQCNSCGDSFNVFYDIANDYYLCSECLDLDNNPELDPDSDSDEFESQQMQRNEQRALEHDNEWRK